MAGITPVISGRGLSSSKRNYHCFNGGNDFQGIDKFLLNYKKTLVSWLIPSRKRIHISPKRETFSRSSTQKCWLGGGICDRSQECFSKKSGREHLGVTFFLVPNAFKVNALVKLGSS